MNDLNISAAQQGMNPVAAIGIAIGVAVMLVVITFTMFLKSSANTTVKQIQAGTQVIRTIQNSNLDTTSPIKADDIAAYEVSLQERLKTIDDNGDFGPDAVSNAALGLTAQP